VARSDATPVTDGKTLNAEGVKLTQTKIFLSRALGDVGH
jgi:hypothetical protein